METNQLNEILVYLKAIAAANPPNLQKALKAYPNFNWQQIGATVLDSDQHGATKVAWCGHLYLRRSGEQKKFGAAIWFSRSAGKGDDGEPNYLRLITFKEGAPQAEPLPGYVVDALSRQR